MSLFALFNAIVRRFSLISSPSADQYRAQFRSPTFSPLSSIVTMSDSESESEIPSVNPDGIDNQRTTTPAVDFFQRMGCQSKMREGAIKACKKRATKAKHQKHRRVSHVQMGVDGKRAFAPELDCAVCKVKHRNKLSGLSEPIPHRSHHRCCPHNRKTRGGSERTVEVERIAQENIRKNNIPPVQVPPAEALKNGSDLLLYFGRNATTATTTKAPNTQSTTSTQETILATSQESMASTSSENNVDVVLPTAGTLQKELGLRMENLEEYKWATAENYKPPIAVALTIDYIISLMRFRRKKLKPAPGTQEPPETQKAKKIFEGLFPVGRCHYEFPLVDPTQEEVDPLYHSIAGQSVYFLDWERHLPGLVIPCPFCKIPLSRGRNLFGKTKSVFPLWRAHMGLPSWVVVFTYRCGGCQKNFNSNDGWVLQKIPAWLRQQYPVYPRYAQGSYHIDMAYSDILESMMVSTASASSFAKLLYRKFNQAYVDKVESYLSLDPFKSYINMQAFTGLTNTPSAESIRDLFLSAETSPLTPYGYSNEERFNREMQSVKVEPNDVVAFDWTHQTLKNYLLPGAKAIFTGNKGSTKEIISLLIVKSTKASQVAHGLLHARKMRENFAPKAVYTDTCPDNRTFWKMVFGAGVVIRLGLFHLIQRIYRTLDKRAEDFWECMVGLKAAMYSYDSADLSKLFEALKDGSFDPSGKRYTSEEIEGIKHSKRWNERFTPYLRKRIHSAAHTVQNLDNWIKDFASRKDGKGRSVFTRETEAVTKEQMKKVEYVADIEDNDTNTYQEIKAGPRSTHFLSKWKTIRPESFLEAFHEFLAHFANTSMRKELADDLSMRGTCEWNVKCRWVEYYQGLDDAKKHLPRYLEDFPPFWDHSMLGYLNKQATDLGLEEPFPFVTPINQDNGERFLSKYFAEQEARNKGGVMDEATKTCRCAQCQQQFDNIGILQDSIENLPEDLNMEDWTPLSVDDEDRAPSICPPAHSAVAGTVVEAAAVHPTTKANFLQDVQNPPGAWQELSMTNWTPLTVEDISQELPMGLGHRSRTNFMVTTPLPPPPPPTFPGMLPMSGAPIPPPYIQQSAAPPMGWAPSTLSAPQVPTPNCRACDHIVRKQLGEKVRGRPPHHEIFCSLANQGRYN